MAAGRTARDLAHQVLRRIDDGGAYANLALGPELERATWLSARDRAFATELVYGTARMRRACDYLVDRFVSRPVDPDVRTVLRLGAYQLHFTAVAPHAAVSATVDLAPRAAKGFVNAVLRRVASSEVVWPDDATRLSYPDWVVGRLVADLGHDAALGALEQMDVSPTVHERADGYVQDEASQWVAALVEAAPGMLVADLCAAPGGKTTALAATGARVVAADVRPARASMVAANAARLSGQVDVLVADGRAPALRPGSFERVLLDAPCSGLGALRRRPDARWRIDEDAVERLARLQRELVDAAVELLAPGGVLVYSVCTLTIDESIGVDEHVAGAHPALEALPPPSAPWQPWGRGALLLPQAAGTDGMYALRLRAPA
ncbi:MAG: rRNA (cytosine967-C5)-methyltransferase [Acidimicrobiaceae bacterium]